MIRLVIVVVILVQIIRLNNNQYENDTNLYLFHLSVLAMSVD